MNHYQCCLKERGFVALIFYCSFGGENILHIQKQNKIPQMASLGFVMPNLPIEGANCSGERELMAEKMANFLLLSVGYGILLPF